MGVKEYKAKPYKNGKYIHYKIYIGLKDNGQPEYQYFRGDKKRAEKQAKILNARASAKRIKSLEKITPEEANDLNWAVDTMAYYGSNIKEAVDWWVKTKNPEKGRLTASEACQKFLLYHSKRLKASTLRQYEAKIRRFEKHLGEKIINEIVEEDILAYFESVGKFWQATTEKPEKDFIKGLFDWFQRNGYIHSHGLTPASNIPVPRKEYPKNKLMRPEEAEGFLYYLLFNAKNKNNGEKKKSIFGTLARYCMVMFGCLRREEASKITWQEINLETKCIEVDQAAAKTSNRRVVKMPENLHKWLLVCSSNNAELVLGNPIKEYPKKNLKRLSYWLRKYRNSFQREEEIPEFAKIITTKNADGSENILAKNKNMPRHSAITYHYEHYGVQKTSENCGSSERTIRSTYKEVNKDAFAPKLWFEINPPEGIQEIDKAEPKIKNVEEAAADSRRLEFLQTLKKDSSVSKELERLNQKVKRWVESDKDNLKQLAELRIKTDTKMQRIRNIALATFARAVNFARSEGKNLKSMSSEEANKNIASKGKEEMARAKKDLFGVTKTFSLCLLNKNEEKKNNQKNI